MLQTAFEQTVLRIKDNVRLSGRLTSQIKLDQYQHLRNKYQNFNQLDPVAIAFLEANNIDVPHCSVCDSIITTFISVTKGFQKYCSNVCYNSALRDRNKTKNKIRNKVVAEKKQQFFLPAIQNAVAEYLREDNNLSIKQIAIKYNIAHNRIRKYISNHHLTRGDLNRKVKEDKFKTITDPRLFDINYLQRCIDEKLTSEWVSKQLGVHKNTVCVHARRLGLNFPGTESTGELEICQYLDELGVSYVRRTRKIIAPRELDIFIPSHNIAIEYNGSIWHSEWAGKLKNYHLDKYDDALAKNIRLLQIFDYEWNQSPQQVRGIILAALGKTIKIHGRKTEVVELTQGEAKHFFRENHLQGHVYAKHCIGLKFQGELVAACSFGVPRFNKIKQAQWELFRFCNKIGLSVIGGFSKILQYFLQITDAKTIISYCHVRLFNGSVYKNSGFELIKQTPPGYFWININNNTILSRYQTQKHKLDTQLTELQFMKNAGYSRVWDCGQKVFQLTRM